MHCHVLFTPIEHYGIQLECDIQDTVKCCIALCCNMGQFSDLKDALSLPISFIKCFLSWLSPW